MLGAVGTTSNGDEKKGGAGGKYDLSRVSSADPFEIELYCCAVPTRNAVQHMVRNWNMSIQRWLVMVVYRRFPIKAGRTFAVFAVTAFMHGVSALHAGTLHAGSLHRDVPRGPLQRRGRRYFLLLY